MLGTGRKVTSRVRQTGAVVCIDDVRTFCLTPPPMKKNFMKKGKLLVMPERTATGTDGPRGKVAARSNQNINADADQDSTRGEITIVAAKRRLIPDCRYIARCVRVHWDWRGDYQRYDMELDFVILRPEVADGPPLTAHINLGKKRGHPQLSKDNWLVRWAEMRDTTDFKQLLLDQEFQIDVVTQTKGRLPDEYYSTVRNPRPLAMLKELEEQEKEQEKEQWRKQARRVAR